MKPVAKNLHNKDMIISCRFHKANILDKIKSYETVPPQRDKFHVTN